MPDITVNPASQITAAQWVAMIKRSPHVPQEIKQGLKTSGNIIVGPARIKHAAGRVPGNWEDNFAEAFKLHHWEITTVRENFEVIPKDKKFLVRRTFLFDIQDGEFGPAFKFSHGYKPDTRELITEYELGQVEFLFGATLASEIVKKTMKEGETGTVVRLKSQRGLIILVNRMNVMGVNPSAQFSPVLSKLFLLLSHFTGASRQFTVPEDSLVATFLHEVAAHAGPMSTGQTSLHGDIFVEENVREIEGPFPEAKILKTKVTGAIDEVYKRLMDLDSRSSGRGRLPDPTEKGTAQGQTSGPSHGGSAQGRPPGPQR